MKSQAYTLKIVIIVVRIISEHSLKAASLVFETVAVRRSLVEKLKFGEGGVGVV